MIILLLSSTNHCIVFGTNYASRLNSVIVKHSLVFKSALSSLKLWVRIPLMAICTRYNIMWLSLSVTCGRSVVFSMLNTITLTQISFTLYYINILVQILSAIFSTANNIHSFLIEVPVPSQESESVVFCNCSDSVVVFLNLDRTTITTIWRLS